MDATHELAVIGDVVVVSKLRPSLFPFPTYLRRYSLGVRSIIEKAFGQVRLPNFSLVGVTDRRVPHVLSPGYNQLRQEVTGQ